MIWSLLSKVALVLGVGRMYSWISLQTQRLSQPVLPEHSIKIVIKHVKGFPDGASVKNPPSNSGDLICGFEPWIKRIPWRRAWQHHLVFLPGEPHGQRSLKGYSLQSLKELDMTEMTQHTHKVCKAESFPTLNELWGELILREKAGFLICQISNYNQSP